LKARPSSDEFFNLIPTFSRNVISDHMLGGSKGSRANSFAIERYDRIEDKL
jgi:hypothetical protein